MKRTKYAALYSACLFLLLKLLSCAHSDITLPLLNRWEQRLLTASELDRLEWGGSGLIEIGSRSTGRPLSGDDSVRAATWNIERGLRYEKILEALERGLASDIYLLQEVDCHARRTGYKNIARLLADYVFGIEFQELAQGRSGRPALHGQAILSRFPIVRARVLRFKHQPNDWSRDLLQPRNGGRMALVAEIETPARRLIVYNAHLESRGNERGRALQMQEILDDIAANRYRDPILIAGDLNTKRGFPSPVIRVAENLGFTDIFLGSSGKKATRGDRRLDWILTRGLVSVSAATHSRIRASDHKPVSAELEFAD